MLMPTETRRQIYEVLFQDGLMIAMKDVRPKTMHPLCNVKNLYVINAMRTCVSKGYVREVFAWRCYYWFLNPAGINYLRDYLHLPAEIVPKTMKKSTIASDMMGSVGTESGAIRGASDRVAYRKGVVGTTPGKPATEGDVRFRTGGTGYGRGRPAN